MSRLRAISLAVPALILVAIAVSFGATAAAQNDLRNAQFRAVLTGYQEAPTPISTTGNGTFRARLTSPTTLEYELSYGALEGGAVSASHIHLAPQGVGGGVIAFLCGGGGKPACPASGTVTGTVTPANVLGPAGQGIAAGEFVELVRAMHAGATYVNVHTATYAAGEIRGQIGTGLNLGN